MIHINRKEQVKRAIKMNKPDYVPVIDVKRIEESDIVFIPVENQFTGLNKDMSEWGFKWDFVNRNIPFGQPKTPLIQTWEDFDKFKVPDPYDESRFSEGLATMAKYGKDKYYLADLTLTGFTIITLIRGFTNALEDLYLERENLEQLMDKVFGFEEDIIKQLKNKGYDAVGLADDWGTQQNLFISPKLWREVFKPRYKKQIELAHSHGLDVFMHSCGYIYEIIPDLIEIGLDMLNPGQPNINGIEKMGRDFGGKICFVCPVSYQTTGISGDKEDIYKEVKSYVEHLGSHNGGLIGFLTGDLYYLNSSPENEKIIYSAFKEYSIY